MEFLTAETDEEEKNGWEMVSRYSVEHSPELSLSKDRSDKMQQTRSIDMKGLG